jgi:hypothetical protein
MQPSPRRCTRRIPFRKQKKHCWRRSLRVVCVWLALLNRIFRKRSNANKYNVSVCALAKNTTETFAPSRRADESHFPRIFLTQARTFPNSQALFGSRATQSARTSEGEHECASCHESRTLVQNLSGDAAGWHSARHHYWHWQRVVAAAAGAPINLPRPPIRHPHRHRRTMHRRHRRGRIKQSSGPSQARN